jgi:D-alanyl-D-alanine carboxypeptidase (penicillin-binding protein 5/6)
MGKWIRWVVLGAVVLWGATADARVLIKSRHPYWSAIVVDADTGRVLWEQNADAVGYPASCIKLMNLLLAVERMERGELAADDPVRVTRESAEIGGSQVYLREGEVLTLDELLNAMIIKSANDAATAVGVHLAGSKAAFVALMNRRAQELGLAATKFTSCHGLPPSPGTAANPDQSTARDLARLGREVVRHPLALRYTSARKGSIRDGAFQLQTHNYLLNTCEGCDGLKTGFFNAAGFSIVATARRNGRRVIAVVMGSPERKVRDRVAQELIEKGFQRLSELPAATPRATPLSGPVRPPWWADRSRLVRTAGIILIAAGLAIVGLSLLHARSGRCS